MGIFAHMLNHLIGRNSPEYEFREIAKHIGCKYSDVLTAFDCQIIHSFPKCDESEYAEFKRYELSVHSHWRIKFGVEKEKRKKSLKKKLEAMRGAHELLNKLILTMGEVMHLSYDYKKFHSNNAADIRQLKNLRDILKTEISHCKKLNISDKIPPRTIPEADLVSIRMAILFQSLDIPITASSHDSKELTGEFSKALECAFRLFRIQASPRGYSSKIVKGELEF